MPKMKTHSGAKKRFRVTGTGKSCASRPTAAPARAQVVDPHAPARRGRHRVPRGRQEGQAPPRHLSPTSTRPDRFGPTKEYPVARVKRAVNAQKKRRDDPRARQRLPRPALAAVPQGQGAGHPLARLRLPRPQEAQGRLPPAVDPAHQRRGPRERHDLQPLHPGPQGRRRRGRPQDARRPRRQRRRRVRRAGRGRPQGAAGRRERAGRLTEPRAVADRDRAAVLRAARG